MAKSRPYTGFDKKANGRREGTEQLIKELMKLTDKGVWHNGSYVVRPKRGKSSPSVHGTGRAADLSWHYVQDVKGSGDYTLACKVMDFLVENAEELGIETVYDYWPKPFGRGWKCDRQAWRSYDRKVMAYTPGSDWIHLEISNEFADNAGHYENLVSSLWGGERPTTGTPRKTLCKMGSKGKATQYLQESLTRHSTRCASCDFSLAADGAFGPLTDASVKAFQSNHNLVADGKCGPKTWTSLDSWADEVL